MTGFAYGNLLDLLGCFVTLSLLSVGGAITTVPEMHRYLVAQNPWLTDSQFSASIALAQAAPGPNVLFVAVLGWNVGMASGGGPANGPLPWALASAAMAVFPAPPSPFLPPAGVSATASAPRYAPSSNRWPPW